MNHYVWFDLNASYAHSSLALPAMHAQIVSHKLDSEINWSVVSATINQPVSLMVQSLIAEKPDAIFATAWLFTVSQLEQVLGRVKALLPNVLIILGGPEFLGDNSSFLRRNPFVDVVFRGEGEEQFPNILSKTLQRKSYDGVDGCCFLDQEGNYHDYGIARVSNFGILLPPESSSFFPTERAFVQLETTRGCFNTCSFCTSGGDNMVRRLSVEQIKERLEYYKKEGIGKIRLLDRTFNAGTRQALEMLDMFEAYADCMSFHLEVHPALLHEKVRERIKQMPKGLLHLEAGIQSLQEEVLVLSTRRGSLKASIDGLRFLSDLESVEVHADLIAGLPHYTWEQLLSDCVTLVEMGVDELQMELLKLLPGTKMRLDAERLGIAYSPFPPYEVLQTTTMTFDELERAKRLSRFIDQYYNTPYFQEIVHRIVKQDSSLFQRFFEELESKNDLDGPRSLEKRAESLSAVVKQYAPHLSSNMILAWLLSGLPYTRLPLKGLRPSKKENFSALTIEKGEGIKTLRLFELEQQIPESKLYYIGYDYTKSMTKPAFLAWERL